MFFEEPRYMSPEEREKIRCDKLRKQYPWLPKIPPKPSPDNGKYWDFDAGDFIPEWFEKDMEKYEEIVKTYDPSSKAEEARADRLMKKASYYPREVQKFKEEREKFEKDLEEYRREWYGNSRTAPAEESAEEEFPLVQVYLQPNEKERSVPKAEEAHIPAVTHRFLPPVDDPSVRASNSSPKEVCKPSPTRKFCVFKEKAAKAMANLEVGEVVKKVMSSF